MTDIHAHHFLNGPRDILLNVAADFADIHFLSQDEVQNNKYCILFRFNAAAIGR